MVWDTSNGTNFTKGEDIFWRMKVGVSWGIEGKGKGKRLIKVRYEASGCSPLLARGFVIRLQDGPDGWSLPHFVPVDLVPSAVAWSGDYPD